MEFQLFTRFLYEYETFFSNNRINGYSKNEGDCLCQKIHYSQI